MRNKKFLCLVLAFVMCFQLAALAACDDVDGGHSNNDSASESTSQSSQSSQNEKTYKLVFNTGSGASHIDTVTGLKEGDKITAPADPVRPRYIFKGWYSDAECTKAFTFNVMPASNLTIYAKWEADENAASLEGYEEALAEASEEGHFYIHYLRFNNVPEEYEPMTLWVWPYAQTGKWFDWERDDGGNIILDDVAGATGVVDLTVKHTDAGKDGKQSMQFLIDGALGENYKTGDIKNPDNYKNKRMGFLIVYKDSVGIAGQHWRSDGNADQIVYIEDMLWDNGSLHVFCVQDNVADHKTHITELQDITNPYENDDGTHISTGNVNSSENLKVNNPTSLLDTVSGVGYQIMVASFADSDGDGVGDIRGIIENLEYLEKLNVDVLWLTPIQLSDSYHGYDIIDYKEVDPKFGSLDDYKELLTKCHEKGMKVIMDLVLNHTSTNNVWFKKSVKMEVEDGIDYRNFYQWRNHTTETLSDAWYPYSEYNYSYYAKFSPSMPELNYDNQDTRDAIADVAKYWLGILGDGKGVDGFRIDAVKHIYMADESRNASGDIIIEDVDSKTGTDYSSNVTKNINFFTFLVNEVKSKFPNAYFVGENFDGHAYNVAPYYTAYDGMLDFFMYYQFGEIAENPNKAALVSGYKSDTSGSQPMGSNTDKLKSGAWNYAAILYQQQSYRKNGIASGMGTGSDVVMGSMFTSNHDLPRLMNNVLGSTVNANWQAGKVTSSNAANAKKYALATISTMMTMPGISFIYYGDELGMSSNYYSGENELSGHADRTYRQPFKWSTSEEGSAYNVTGLSISGDTTLYVDWDAYNKTLDGALEQDGASTSFLNTVRYWTKVKSEDEVLRYGSYEYYDGYKNVWGEGSAAPLFAFKRSYNGTTYLCITNFSESKYKNMKEVHKKSSSALKYASSGCTYDEIVSGGTIVIKL